jgi:hypothetical protein
MRRSLKRVRRPKRKVLERREILRMIAKEKRQLGMMTRARVSNGEISLGGLRLRLLWVSLPGVLVRILRMMA